MFQLTKEEFEGIRALSGNKETYGGRRYLPMVFTECGVAMLSSILTSGRAAHVNISIMRTFVRLRSFLAMENSLTRRVDSLEDDVQKLFKVIFQKLDTLEGQISPRLSPTRKKIGLRGN